MLKRLFALLSRAPAPAPAVASNTGDADDADAESRLIEQAAAYRSAMVRFMEVIAGHLAADERERLTSHILEEFDNGEVASDPETVSELFHEAIFGGDGQQHEHRLLIGVDWKASDEIDWQANLILALHGIDDQWEWDSDGKTVMEGMVALSAWLTRHALALLSVDFGHDAYYMAIVPADIAPQAITLGQRAGLDVLSFADFAATQNA